jgi:hypothetical protein
MIRYIPLELPGFTLKHVGMAISDVYFTFPGVNHWYIFLVGLDFWICLEQKLNLVQI